MVVSKVSCHRGRRGEREREERKKKRRIRVNGNVRISGRREEKREREESPGGMVVVAICGRGHTWLKQSHTINTLRHLVESLCLTCTHTYKLC